MVKQNNLRFTVCLFSDKNIPRMCIAVNVAVQEYHPCVYVNQNIWDFRRWAKFLIENVNVSNSVAFDKLHNNSSFGTLKHVHFWQVKVRVIFEVISEPFAIDYFLFEVELLEEPALKVL